MKSIFTAEELAELAAFDAEIDGKPMTPEDWKETTRRDYEIRGEHFDKTQKAKRAYREANREKIAEAQRAYYEANREKIAEARRAYYEANREKIAEVQRDYVRGIRRALGYSQRALGDLLGVSQRIISYYECGEIPINMNLFQPIKGTELYEAFSILEERA